MDPHDATGHPLNLVRPAAIRFARLPPLALYIHVPWCLAKCPYCDFNSHALREPIPENRFVAALLADLEQSLAAVWGRPIVSVFFGGGTPSLLAPETLDRILSGTRALLPLLPDAEITLEANPGTAESSRFRAFRALGINRLSIGIQTFDRERLKTLGRVHDDREARAAADMAQREFANFNLDLMYGLPNQSIEDALEDVSSALTFAPPHLSAYHLTLEPNTLFHRSPPKNLPSEDTAEAMQDAIERMLADAGYLHYETSAFARPDRLARHNLNYWQFGDYLGIGPGAHSKLSSRDGVRRQIRHKHPQAYMERALAGDAVMESTEVGVDDIGFEFMMNALRLTDGVPLTLFQERAGVPLARVEEGLRRAEQQGLLARDPLRIAPTRLGQRFLNDLLQIFLPN